MLKTTDMYNYINIYFYIHAQMCYLLTITINSTMRFIAQCTTWLIKELYLILSYRFEEVYATII